MPRGENLEGQPGYLVAVGRRRLGGATGQAQGVQVAARRLPRVAGLGRGQAAQQVGPMLAAEQEEPRPRRAEPRDDGGARAEARRV